MAINANSELTDLRRAILSMGAAVEQRVTRVVESLVDHDLAVARDVRTGDDEIDRMEIAIEEKCLRVLALSAPVASDLRFILSVLRINTDLERIADLAKNIAKRVIDLAQYDISVPKPVIEMGQCTRRMLGDALEALSNNDAALAQQVRTADDRVDRLQKEMFAWAHHEIHERHDTAEAAIDLLSIARALERIADMCTNIAEDIIFLIEGHVVRHARLGAT